MGYFTKIATAAIASTMLMVGAASASTVALNNGDIINPMAAGTTYTYEEIFTSAGGADTRSFQFAVASTPMTVSAINLTLTGKQNRFSNPFMSWYDAATNTTTFAAFNYITGTGWSASLSQLFTSTALNTLTIGWSGHKAPVQISLQIAAVPLPAGGLLLAGAIGGVAALRRRKSV